jgi:SAM-dependent methyltransferase
MAMSHYPGKDLEAMSFAINYHRWIIDEFRPYLGEVVAEVGAGSGNISKLLLQSQIKRLVAFEPSKNLYPLLKEELQQDERARTVNDRFRSTYKDHGFDSIVYINVLEHIDDDRAELAGAREALKPNGHLLVFVPALPWLYSDFDKQIGHIRRYVKKELDRLVREVGFALVKARYFDMAGIVPWYLKFVLFRSTMGSGSVAWYDRIIVPTARLMESVGPPPLGKNVLLVGKKV